MVKVIGWRFDTSECLTFVTCGIIGHTRKLCDKRKFLGLTLWLDNLDMALG